MGDQITCLALRYGTIPVAFLLFLVTAYLFYKYRTEPDLIHRDVIGDRVKYAAIFLALTLLFALILYYAVSNGLLGMNCSQTEPIIIDEPSCRTVNEFANGTSRTITFPVHGGTDTQTAINLPRNAQLKNASFTIEYTETGEWTDEFENWTRIAESTAIDIDRQKGYAYIKINKLVVNTTIILQGEQTYDEVYIKNGGIITTDVGQKLHLKINGPLTIEEGGGINVDGKGDNELDRGGVNTEPGYVWGSGGGGGSYGGKGGNGGNDEGLSGGISSPAYGSVEEPFDLGSAGANGGAPQGAAGSGLPGTGSLGGGAVHIEARDILVNGQITANGLPGKDATSREGTGGGGGGSGGSIMIEADTITINDKITGDGGPGGNDPGEDAGGGGGGGGRISIKYKSINGEANIHAYGAKGGTADPDKEGKDGERGTVHLKQSGNEIKSELITGRLTSKEISLDNLRCWTIFKAKTENPAGSQVVFRILNASNNKTLCEISNDNANKGYNTSNCSACATAIRLKAELVSIDIAKTPMIHNWRIGYETGIKNLSVNIGEDQSEEYVKSVFSGQTTINDENTDPRISEEITMYASECKCMGCRATENNCTIRVGLKSLSSGRLTLNSPQFEYCIG